MIPNKYNFKFYVKRLVALYGYVRQLIPSTVCIVQLKRDGTRWRTGGEVKAKLANGGVASTLHTTSELGVSSITTADAHTSAASSRLNWRPRLFKWTRPFRRKTKSGFCACAITFQTHSTISFLKLSSNWFDTFSRIVYSHFLRQ